ATAVVVNLTATQAAAPGHVTAYPCGQPQPTTSVLNYQPGRDVANTTIVDIGTDGKICLYTLTDVHLVVDVQGHFNGGDDYTSHAPERILDTRSAGSANQAGTAHEVPLARPAALPIDATAVVVNLTATQAAAPGHVTA